MSSVNLKKLTRQLRREAQGSPKKAAFLGLMVLLALYYWTPMVWGWIARGHGSGQMPSPGTVTKLDPPASGDGPPDQPAALTAAAACPHPWTQLDQWMRQDPRTTPAENLAGRRDPFAVKSRPAELPEDEAPGPLQVTPAGLRLELSSTVVGPRRRVAMIAGKAYQRGETIRIDRDGRWVEFELVEVGRRRIVLRREGELFELVIPEEKGSGRMYLSGS